MDEETPFLDSRPPHWAANGLAYLVVIVFVLAAAAFVTVEVPETVTSSFVLVPARGSDPVRASRSGIVSEVHVTEGQSVQQGEPLFVMQSSPIGDRSSELSTLETQLKGAEESLRNTRKEYESRQQADSEEARRLENRLASLAETIKLKQEQLALAMDLVQRYEEGFKQGVMSRVQFIQPKLDAAAMALALEESEKDRKDVQASLEKLRHESGGGAARQRELERSLKEAMDKNRIRAAGLRKELVHSQSNELSIPAPCSGTILRLLVKAPAAFVNEGEHLCELACTADKLQADLTLPQSASAQVRLGHEVKLLYDAFPYQRFGVRYGTVRWLSPSMISPQTDTGFHGFADIEDEAIVVDGQERPLLPGMRGMAKIVVGKRTLVSYAFEPLRQLQENLISDAEECRMGKESDLKKEKKHEDKKQTPEEKPESKRSCRQKP